MENLSLSVSAADSLECFASLCMFDRIIYWLVLGVVTVIRCLPLSVCFVGGQIVGAGLWAILPSYRRLARENLHRALGDEHSPAELRRLTFRHFTTLGANAICSFKMAALSDAQVQESVTFENKDGIFNALEKKRGVVFIISHIGNWELLAQLTSLAPGYKSSTIYQALRNKGIDDLINRDRRAKGIITLDRKRGVTKAVSLLREGGLVGVLIDQHAGVAGVCMPFFNSLASTSPLAASLATRTGAVVLPCAIYTDGFARWRFVIGEEIPNTKVTADENNPDTAAGTSATNALAYTLNRTLEAQIRRSPADWFWVHNRWKIPHPEFLTATQKRGTWLPEGLDPKTLTPFRILVRSPNWLGDAVMSIRAARAFKTSRPDAHLTILAPAKLTALWESVPEVDAVIPFAAEESVFAVAKKLRGHFEVAVLMPNSLRSAIEVWLAGIPRRVGFHGHFREKLLNQTVRERKKSKKPPRPEHHADRYWRLAEGCGAIEPPPLPLRHTPGTDCVIGLCPGAEYGAAKRWPVEKFRELMKLVSARLSCTWVVVGTAADTPLAEEILQGFDLARGIDLTGKTSLKELMAKLQTLTVLVTNDTGTMHLADFLGVPLVSIFGSTEPRLTGPRSPQSIAIRHQVECSPCFLRECPIDFRCMAAVTAEEVADKVEGLVEKKLARSAPPIR